MKKATRTNSALRPAPSFARQNEESFESSICYTGHGEMGLQQNHKMEAKKTRTFQSAPGWKCKCAMPVTRCSPIKEIHIQHTIYRTMAGNSAQPVYRGTIWTRLSLSSLLSRIAGQRSGSRAVPPTETWSRPCVAGALPTSKSRTTRRRLYILRQRSLRPWRAALGVWRAEIDWKGKPDAHTRKPKEKYDRRWLP